MGVIGGKQLFAIWKPGWERRAKREHTCSVSGHLVLLLSQPVQPALSEDPHTSDTFLAWCPEARSGPTALFVIYTQLSSLCLSLEWYRIISISYSKQTHSFNVIFPTLALGSFFFLLKMCYFLPIPLLHSFNFKQTKQIMSHIIGQRHLQGRIRLSHSSPTSIILFIDLFFFLIPISHLLFLCSCSLLIPIMDQNLSYICYRLLKVSVYG